MNNDESEKFKIDLEEDNGQSETEDISLEPGMSDMPRSRIPFFALFLGFIALVGLIFFVYLNLGTKINAITKAGETRIQTVSSGVGDRLDSVSKQMDEFKKDMGKQVSTLASDEKKDKEDIRTLSKKIAHLSKTLEDITRDHARTRKEVSALGTLLEKIKTANDQSTAGITKRLKTAEAGIKDLIGAQADTLSGLRDQLDMLSKRLDDLAAASIDQEQVNGAVDDAVAAMNKTITQRLDQADARHARELSDVRSEISRIRASASADSPPKPAGPEPEEIKTPESQAPAKTFPDGIIEQEIK